MDITVSLAESEKLGSDKIVYTHNPVVIDIDAGDSSLFGNYVNIAFAILDGTGNNADGTYRCLNPELCAGKAQADISSYLRELMEDYGGGITSAGWRCGTRCSASSPIRAGWRKSRSPCPR